MLTLGLSRILLGCPIVSIFSPPCLFLASRVIVLLLGKLCLKMNGNRSSSCCQMNIECQYSLYVPWEPRKAGTVRNWVSSYKLCFSESSLWYSFTKPGAGGGGICLWLPNLLFALWRSRGFVYNQYSSPSCSLHLPTLGFCSTASCSGLTIR